MNTSLIYKARAFQCQFDTKTKILSILLDIFYQSCSCERFTARISMTPVYLQRAYPTVSFG